MSRMVSLQSDIANEFTENVHAFDIIAANGPLKPRGVGLWWVVVGRLKDALGFLVGSAIH